MAATTEYVKTVNFYHAKRNPLLTVLEKVLVFGQDVLSTRGVRSLQLFGMLFSFYDLLFNNFIILYSKILHSRNSEEY